MAQFDIASNQEVLLNFRTPIAGNGITNAPAIDTKNYCAIYFNIGLAAYTDGNYALTLQERDDTISAWTNIPAEKFIDNATSADLNISADITQGNVLPQVGVFSTLNFVRAQIASTGVSSGATIYCTLTGQLINAVNQ